MSEKTCTVNAKEFQQALAKVLKAAAKRSALPFLEEAHIRFDGRTCTLTCTDLVSGVYPRTGRGLCFRTDRQPEAPGRVQVFFRCFGFQLPGGAAAGRQVEEA